MAIYSVYLPSDARLEVVADRAVFVRDGFAFWAFLFGPLWFLRHREWLGLVGWLVIATLLGIAGAFVGGAISSFLGIGSFTGWNIKSMVIAVIGAVLVLAIWRKVKK